MPKKRTTVKLTEEELLRIAESKKFVEWTINHHTIVTPDGWVRSTQNLLAILDRIGE